MVVASEVLALDVSAGTSGFLIVVLLCLAAVGIFVLMFGSLRRLRGNVDSGEFGAAARRGDEAGAPDGGEAPDPATGGKAASGQVTGAKAGAAGDQPASAGVPGPRTAEK